MERVSRRSLIRKTSVTGAAGVVGGSSLLSGCLEDVTGGGGLKIGIINPYSGISRWGEISTWGFLSGLSSVYGEKLTFEPDTSWAASEGLTFEPGDGDKKYEIFFRDTVFQTDTAKRAAETFVLEDDVDILYGSVSTSSTRRIIEQVAKPTDTLYLVGGSSSTATVGDTDLCGRKVFRASEHIGMEARACGKYIGEETETESVYILGPDSQFGRSFAGQYRRSLEDHGVEVAGRRLVAGGFSEFRGILENIDEDADAVAINFSGNTLNRFLPTFVRGNLSSAFDLRAYGPLPGQYSMNLIYNTLESELDEITEESLQEANMGEFVSRYSWNHYNNPINEEFVSDFMETYGTVPSFFAGGAFASGSAVAQAVEETGSLDPDDIAEAMYGMRVESTPKGEKGYAFQEHNNQAKSPMTVAKMVPNRQEDWGAGLMPGEPLMTVGADEVASPTDDPDMTCDLRES